MNIYGIFDLPFYLWAIFFGVSTILAFYAPGFFFISRLKIKSNILNILLSHVLGIALWAAQGVVFGYLHLRGATYFYLAFFLGALFFQRTSAVLSYKNAVKELRKSNPTAWYIACAGIISQMLLIWGSGLRFSEGIGFFQSNAYDGVMHLGFIQDIVQRFPPEEPGAVGLPILNYHLWSDIAMAELSRIFHLPITHLFFQYMPLYIAILTTVALYFLVRMWKGTRIVGNWALFITFFAGDAAFIFMLALHHIFGFYTPAIDNGVTQFLNVPHTFAKLIFLCSLITFTTWLRSRRKAWGILTTLLMATLVGFKVYFGIFAALGFSLVVLAEILQDFFQNKKRRNFIDNFKNAVYKNLFSIFLICLFAIISAVIYFPFNKGAGGLFYAPLEWPKIFLSEQNIGLGGWWQRHEIYSANHDFVKLFILDLSAIAICLVCIYGTRMLGFLPAFKTKLSDYQINIFFFPTMILFTLLGLFTLQQAGLFNVFNFFVVSCVGLTIYSAFFLAEIQKKKSVFSTLFLVAFVLFTIPRPINDVIQVVQKYKKHDFDLLIKPDEEEALNYLRTHAAAGEIVQSHQGNFKDSETPYVGYFSGHPTFLSGIRMLESHNQPIEERKKELGMIFSSEGADQDLKTQLLKHNIKYLYLRKNERDDQFRFVLNDDYFVTFFENDTVKILQPVRPQ